MENAALGILIMAAGKGTRMKSELPKVLLPILDRPMLGYLLSTVKKYVHPEDESADSPSARVAALVGYGGERVSGYLRAFPSVEIIWQKEQLGTGHAVQTARPWWENFQNVLVLNGDLPLLSVESLRTFVREHMEAGAACSLLTFETNSPDGYGRILRAAYGKKVFVVEHRDATPEQRRVREVNAGCYLFDVKGLSRVIDELRNDNAQGEYYLPDVVSLMNDAGMVVRATAVDGREMLGVNTQAELAAMAMRVRDSLIHDWMSRGVRVMDPSAVWIGPGVVLEPEVTLMPGVQIWGNSLVGSGSVIGPYCILKNARLGRRVELVANVIVEDSELADDSKAGPFTCIRDHSELGEHAFAGKFVELKKSRVGRRSKVPHLSYMGDAMIGEDVNIGAGSVTCNYDGKDKYSTKIGNRVFVGSDTMMVAPVTLHDDSATGAGSTITVDVPEGALAVARARQKNLEGWASKKRQQEKQGG
ncbi:MAG: bifunctional UDP-N-acetylglucosamine diphosphorylase/glucosamine-1-phosphate N-acetyltransferase GlmU [Synergistaceae bacterium]|jgi:bifunctional UDP-N-acetylglucosamine pyrophosphorylase/glucosamine-1-phosphate N-acetyltransferase|nr:bifunctional UDP-N-acetylglucosamine diphosphorylase/glucosamine-1-phosphate N-acetyltransferase GlmU [Synergistaceae bacterium]